MSRTIKINDQNTSKASQQIKIYVVSKKPDKIRGSLFTYKITLAEVRQNFSKLSKVYRLLMVNNADQVLFYEQQPFFKK